MSLKSFIKNIINPEEVTSEVIKKKENHTQVATIEMALELANLERAKYPSNKVKLNLYTFRDNRPKGYKCIPFCDFTLDGEPATVEIFKIKN
jgi:hypothetical protein